MVINPEIGRALNEKYGNKLIDETLKVLISNPFKKNEELVLSILSTLNNISYYYTSDSEIDVFHTKQVDIAEGETLCLLLIFTIIKMKPILAVKEFTKIKNKECVTETMRILGNLSRSKVTRNYIAETDIFETLINLLDKGERKVFLSLEVKNALTF